MPRQFRIRVYGAQRRNIDPALLAQLMILFGRHLNEKHRHQHSHRTATAKDTTASQTQPSARHTEDHPAPPPDDTAPRNNEGEVS